MVSIFLLRKFVNGIPCYLDIKIHEFKVVKEMIITIDKLKKLVYANP